MSLISVILDHLFGERVTKPVLLDKVLWFHSTDGDWAFQKVQYVESRPGLALGGVELSPILIVGYGYRLVASPRPVRSDYVEYRGLDLQRAMEQAERGMRIADRERMENGLLFKDTFLRHS